MFPPVEKINFKCHLFNCLLCLIKNGNLFDLFVAYLICCFIKGITEILFLITKTEDFLEYFFQNVLALDKIKTILVTCSVTLERWIKGKGSIIS